MPDFFIRHHIDASVETVWSVLDDFGDIQRWNPGVRASALTSEGPVGRGSARRCDLIPFGAVDERIERYEPGTRMTVEIHSTRKLPIANAVADIELAPTGTGTDLTIHYQYELNRLGRAMKRTVDRLLRSGLNGLAEGLTTESERLDHDRDED